MFKSSFSFNFKLFRQNNKHRDESWGHVLSIKQHLVMSVTSGLASTGSCSSCVALPTVESTYAMKWAYKWVNDSNTARFALERCLSLESLSTGDHRKLFGLAFPLVCVCVTVSPQELPLWVNTHTCITCLHTLVCVIHQVDEIDGCSFMRPFDSVFD